MSNFRSDLKDMPFVKCPANSVSLLYDQYLHDLSRILARHAPLVSSLKTKQRADWLSESYTLQSNSDINLKVPGEKIKVNTAGVVFGIKSPGLRLANRDKTVYCRKLISDNSHDSKKLWWELHKVLHRSHSTTLPTCESSKSLADHFATFFSNKIKKICESFSSSESCNMVHPRVGTITEKRLQIQMQMIFRRQIQIQIQIQMIFRRQIQIQIHRVQIQI